MKFSFPILLTKNIPKYADFNILQIVPHLGIIFGKYVSSTDSKYEKYFEYSEKIKNTKESSFKFFILGPHAFSAIVRGKYGTMKYYSICAADHEIQLLTPFSLIEQYSDDLGLQSTVFTCILPFVVIIVLGAWLCYNPHFTDEDPNPPEVNDLSKDTSIMGQKSLGVRLQGSFHLICISRVGVTG